MVKIINILERIKDYDCVINPPIKRNTNPETLKKVQGNVIIFFSPDEEFLRKM